MSGHDKGGILKAAALGAIAQLPDTATLDDIMYCLHVIEKVRKGEDAVKRGETVSTDELKKEVASWSDLT